MPGINLSTAGLSHRITPVAILVLCAVLLAQCKPAYRPTLQDAFSYAAGFANQALATYEWHSSNPGCEHRPEFYNLAVEERADGTYLVKGRVVTGNVFCVKDQSSFTASIRFVSEGHWELLEPVDFSNECVLFSAYDLIRLDPYACFQSQWSPP